MCCAKTDSTTLKRDAGKRTAHCSRTTTFIVQSMNNLTPIDATALASGSPPAKWYIIMNVDGMQSNYSDFPGVRREMQNTRTHRTRLLSNPAADDCRRTVRAFAHLQCADITYLYSSVEHTELLLLAMVILWRKRIFKNIEYFIIHLVNVSCPCPKMFQWRL